MRYIKSPGDIITHICYNIYVMFMKLINESYVEIKKSKFIGLYYHLDNLEEVKTILESLQKEHKKARHMPYAYKFENTAKKTDDKEPSNTAGLPIYNIIERKQLIETFKMK